MPKGKSVFNNISLLTIALCGIFIINVISESVIEGIKQIHRDKDYEIEFRVWNSDRITESRLKALEGITTIEEILRVSKD